VNRAGIGAATSSHNHSSVSTSVLGVQIYSRSVQGGSRATQILEFTIRDPQGLARTKDAGEKAEESRDVRILLAWRDRANLLVLVLCPVSGWIRARVCVLCVCACAMIPRLDSERSGVHCAFPGTETHTSHVMHSTKLVPGYVALLSRCFGRHARTHARTHTHMQHTHLEDWSMEFSKSEILSGKTRLWENATFQQQLTTEHARTAQLFGFFGFFDFFGSMACLVSLISLIFLVYLVSQINSSAFSLLFFCFSSAFPLLFPLLFVLPFFFLCFAFILPFLCLTLSCL
jgi:hypothetical protein